MDNVKPKRGKDIKTFADLPSEVRRIIDVMSTTDGKIDKTAKDRRTAIAIRYQHVLDSSQRDKVLPLLRKYAYTGQA